MDGSLYRVIPADLKFGNLLHNLALSPYLSDQTVIEVQLYFDLIYIIKRKVCMYVPTFLLCLLTDFTTKYTYGFLMIQGVSEKYKSAEFQEIFVFE